MLIVLQGLMSVGATCDQWAPSSSVSWTRPSSVPAQIMPFFKGDSASAKMVS